MAKIGQPNAWWALIAAGVAGAILAGGLGEVTSNWFSARGNFALGPMQGGGATLGSIRDAAVRNASLTYSAQGAILGLAFGLAGASGNRRRAQGAIGTVFGLVAGMVAGLLVSHQAYRMFLRVMDPNSDDLIMPMLAHGLVWGIVGAIAGLAYGLGNGTGAVRAGVGGLIGGVLAAGLFQVVGAVLFPSDETTHPLADATIPRLLAHASLALLVATVIGLTRPGTPTATVPAAPPG